MRRMFDSAIIKEIVFDVEPAKTKGEEHTDESYATVVMPANKCQLKFFMQRRCRWQQTCKNPRRLRN